jgi:hypothetical protein
VFWIQTGVKEDISRAKLAVFEVKKNYYTWKMTTLSFNQCRLLKNEAVVDILELFRQCGILECSDSVIFWNVPTVWYLF